MDHETTGRSQRPTIESVRASIEEWRSRREGRARMSEPLWRAAVALAREHGCWRISQALRVRHDTLKSKLAASGPASPGRAAKGGFVEVAPVSPPTPPSAATVIELSRLDGARLTFRLSGATGPDLESIISAFCPAPPMIQVTPHMRVLVAIEPVDFRRGIDGLARECRAVLRENPFSGAVFVFRNRRRTAIKVLVYDGQGYWLCQKRWSSGRFEHWPTAEDPTLKLDAHELHVLLRGGDPRATRASPEWRPVSLAN